MSKRFNPFENMDPKEIARRMYSPSVPDDEVNEMVADLGGVDGINTFTKIDREEQFKELLGDDPNTVYYKVDIKDFNNTVFKKQNCSLRAYGSFLDCFHIDGNVYVGCKNKLIEYMKAVAQMYANKNNGEVVEAEIE